MRKLKHAAALKYEPEKDRAPQVIASGRGYVAEKIISIARENNIPEFENQQAAEILCKLPLNSEIPQVLYQVIAEIYAFILKVEKENNLP